MTPRQYLMAAGLAVSAALALWGDKRLADDSVDAPLPSARAVAAPAAPPPLAAPVAEQAAPAAAPVVPFTVLDKALSNNTWEVFLANGNNTYVIHENSTVDYTYRIDSIQPPALQLTYLPMNTVQHLDIGAAQ
ncbi:MAG: hypothetical protein GAK31_01612 [Stenotrophomonas maltophilia]|uniref:Uncharacterized protein n=1 Tax=Stenotrophomonas maltophilia TaxID=40324 RepID=A0A7V8FHV2_STEMA|nr:MAG: hypothetical protein GAK31_01612 [Stenotrophomonas maltophilia]